MSYLCLCLCLCASENQPLFTGHPKRFILTIKTSVISSKLDWFKHFFSCNHFLVSKLPFYEIFTRNLSLQHDKMYYVYCEVFFPWNPTQVRIADLFFILVQWCFGPKITIWYYAVKFLILIHSLQKRARHNRVQFGIKWLQHSTIVPVYHLMLTNDLLEIMLEYYKTGIKRNWELKKWQLALYLMSRQSWKTC